LTFEEQIRSSVGAHGLWKGRLRTAIDSGSSPFSPEAIRVDDACEFGRWLYSLAGTEYRAHPLFETVRNKHAEFHLTAASVLQLALSGNKEAARQMIAPGSRFAVLSLEL